MLKIFASPRTSCEIFRSIRIHLYELFGRNMSQMTEMENKRKTAVRVFFSIRNTVSNFWLPPGKFKYLFQTICRSRKPPKFSKSRKSIFRRFWKKRDFWIYFGDVIPYLVPRHSISFSEGSEVMKVFCLNWGCTCPWSIILLNWVPGAWKVPDHW